MKHPETWPIIAQRAIKRSFLRPPFSKGSSDPLVPNRSSHLSPLCSRLLQVLRSSHQLSAPRKTNGQVAGFAFPCAAGLALVGRDVVGQPTLTQGIGRAHGPMALNAWELFEVVSVPSFNLNKKDLKCLQKREKSYKHLPNPSQNSSVLMI